LGKKVKSSAAATRLRSLLWRPIEKHLGGAKVVLISPDGALARLPFAALPGRKAGSYLIEDVALAILPTPAAASAA
jgi:CHAT domain-containing protein